MSEPKPRWLEVYCWRCGEKYDIPFSFKEASYGHIGVGCCPSCGTRIYIPKLDILEVKDRRERRGIPR